MPKGIKPPGWRTPGARTCWIEKGTTDDRNRINRASDNGATGSFSAVVAQPQLGLHPAGGVGTILLVVVVLVLLGRL